MKKEKKPMGKLDAWLNSDEFQTIVIDVSELDLEKAIFAINDCLDVRLGQFRDDGTLWIVTKNRAEDGRLIPVPFAIAEELISRGFKLKNIIIWPSFKDIQESNI